MPPFTLVSVKPLTMERSNRLINMYVLSPFVWRDGEHWRILVRAVPRRDDDPRLKMAEIWHGTSEDGFHFKMDIAPALFPGPDEADLDGCEDPTVILAHDGLSVWYTGYNERQKMGRLMLARGPAPNLLEKHGVILNSTDRFKNPKEATIVPADNGWRMYFEYARDGASLIGQARTDLLDGIWQDRSDGPIEPRRDKWDAWHLSPGPVIGGRSDAPVMFYNGATKEAQWRIGWAVFDKGLSRLVARCDEPLVVPDGKRSDGDSDIAFAASAVEYDGDVRIYFSQSDRDIRCAMIRRG